ncbi:hypothetical protein [uncultured Deinococcus sp.]|uniref:hypothetical protein n=1 Tax=uncultured Deinococcus sp. TaxID=158789 RepID=UPI0025E27ED7|nr:hypothetical protein [uncultured Deinococcus sp.]
MEKSLKATVKDVTFQLDPQQAQGAPVDVRQIEEHVNAAVAQQQGHPHPGMGAKHGALVPVTVDPGRIKLRQYRLDVPAWPDLNERSQQSEGVFTSVLDVDLVEVHCPKADKATAKLSKVNSKTFESSVEVKLAVITGGITGSVTLELKESYTATNECVRMSVRLPTLVQTVRVTEGAREPYFMTRVLEVFEGDADVVIQPIEICACRTERTAEDLNLSDRDYQNKRNEGAGSLEYSESVQINSTAKLGVKAPFGPLDDKGKPLHEITAGVSFKDTHQLTFTYTLPGPATYPYVNTRENRGLIWLKPVPV